MSADWRWHRAPALQPGWMLGSDYPGVVLDLVVPAAATDLAPAAAALERALGLVPGSLPASDPAALVAQVLGELAGMAGLPVPEPVRRLHRVPERLGFRVPALPRSGASLVSACECLLATLRDPSSGGAHAGWARVTEELRTARPRTSNTFRFMRAAQDAGIPVAEIAPRVAQYGLGRRSQWLDSSFTEETSVISANLARDKALASAQLRRAGLPVPAQSRAADADAAVEAARRIGYPVVVKPADRDGGLGVSAGLADDVAVAAAFERARQHSSNVLVEKFVPGRDYRLMVHRGELIWAIERVPAVVTGDGAASIAQLVERLNADPLRRGPQATLKQVPLDEEALDLLKSAGLDAASVPEAGRIVRLRRAANVATGGMPLAALDQVHPDNALLAIRAAEALRLDLAGIDLLIPDISRSWLETGAGICEINAQPNLGALTSAHVYGQLLRRLVPGNGRIPVVAVLGAPRAQGLERAIADAAQARGLQAGVADARGVRLGTALLAGGAVPPFHAVQPLLLDRGTAAVVFAVNEPSLLLTGLPCPCLDLLVLAGNDVDPLPGDTPDATRARLETMLRLQCDGEVLPLPAGAADAVADAIVAIDARHSNG